MRTLLSLLSNISQAASTLRMLLVDMLHFLRLCLRSPTALAAENLFQSGNTKFCCNYLFSLAYPELSSGGNTLAAS